MRILFIGGTDGNAGPQNVNKGIVNNLSPSFLHLKSKNKYFRYIELFGKMLVSDVIVSSTAMKHSCVITPLAKFLGKKMILIMHGCVAYEVVSNRQRVEAKDLQRERYMYDNVDLILAVSRKFMLWFRERYPEYADKTEYIYNGVELKDIPPIQEKKHGSIAATGADRKVKNNSIVAQAVAQMNSEAELTIYGAIYHRKEIQESEHVHYTGVISHDAFLKALSKTSVFVLNSIFESFSLSTLEALACGCSVLISENAGVTDLLALEETDIIHDPMDVEEIRSKIEYLMENPNYERLMSQFDPKEWSFAKMVERLEEKCEKLIGLK